MALLNFNCQSIFNGPILGKPHPKRVLVDILFSGPLSNSFSLPKISKPYVGSSVISLLRSGSPLAIIRRITKIVVKTFNCKVWGTVSHIRKKVFEAVPAFANLYTPTSVSFVGRIVRIRTPLAHSSPYSKFPRAGQSVLETRFGSLLCSITSARFNLSASKVRSANGGFSTTLAKTFPHCLSGRARRSANNTQMPVLLSSHIVKGSHSFKLKQNNWFCKVVLHG